MIYRGTPHHTVTVHTDDGQLIGPLHHHVKHSPDGFSWGYAGSGAAELARCLLIAHLGDSARCSLCRGVARVTACDVGGDPSEVAFRPFEPGDDPDDVTSCFACGGSGFGPQVERLYQTFKFATVATWKDRAWELSDREIGAWLAGHEIAVH